MKPCRVVQQRICALRLAANSGLPVVDHIPDGARIQVSGPFVRAGMLEVTDGTNRYAAFACDLFARSIDATNSRLTDDSDSLTPVEYAYGVARA